MYLNLMLTSQDILMCQFQCGGGSVGIDSGKEGLNLFYITADIKNISNWDYSLLYVLIITYIQRLACFLIRLIGRLYNVLITNLCVEKFEQTIFQFTPWKSGYRSLYNMLLTSHRVLGNKNLKFLVHLGVLPQDINVQWKKRRVNNFPSWIYWWQWRKVMRLDHKVFQKLKYIACLLPY